MRNEKHLAWDIIENVFSPKRPTLQYLHLSSLYRLNGGRLLSLISFSRILFFRLFVCFSVFLSPFSNSFFLKSKHPNTFIHLSSDSFQHFSWLTFSPFPTIFFDCPFCVAFVVSSRIKKCHNRFCVFSTIASNNYLHMHRNVAEEKIFLNVVFQQFCNQV